MTRRELLTRMIPIYADLVLAGRRTIETVPEEIRALVAEAAETGGEAADGAAG